MPNHLLRMQLVRRIIQLLQRGYPERSISRELKVSRTTIRRYTERFRQQQLSYSSLLALDDAHLSAIVYPPAPTPVTDPRKSGFDALAGYFISELTRTGVTRLLLWQEYRRDYPDGYEYSRFCDMLKDHTPTHQRTTATDMKQYTGLPKAHLIGFSCIPDKLPFFGRP